ncbi:MAG: hypothetical protein RLZZ214_2737 [Verrucomicrobiota bacterium]
MRALLFFLPVVVAGCSNYTAPQREILKRSQAEIELREPWSASAAVFVTNPNDPARFNWKVSAGALDYSAYRPLYKGTYFIPGTERELTFTPDGCLTGYVYNGSSCTAPITWDSSGQMLPGK